MWNAFGNGSRPYVSKAQGWEFVPCNRLEKDRGRRKSRSPLRTLSSPASVGRFHEQQLPGLEVNSETAQHSLLKKKLEELKKRHGQEKQEWAREKELLLREVADIQGGENRRILLDLKAVLEDVQLEVKREEAKRCELQLLYTKDRYAWELERAELKCRIAQLEARGSEAGVEALQRHSATMELRWRGENGEVSWAREKAELLERFHTERKEWETQLRDMQRKVEELYNERKTQEEADIGPISWAHNRLPRQNLLSSSKRSSICTSPAGCHDHSYCDLPELHSNSYSDPTDRNSNGYSDWVDQHSNSGQDLDVVELEGFLHGSPHQGSDTLQSVPGHSLQSVPGHTLQSVPGHTIISSSYSAQQDLRRPNLSTNRVYSSPSPTRNLNFFSLDPAGGNDRKYNTTTLNSALKEIARVSKELCSYQDEIRRRSEEKRSTLEALSLLQEFEEEGKVKNASKQNLWCDLLTLEDPTGINGEGGTDDVGSRLPQRKTEAPPIPPRTTSWCLNNSVPGEAQARSQQGPTVTPNWRCSSPSVLRKFGAMLQENEGKILTDSGVVADSRYNIGCCQSQWSCAGSKSSTYVPVQKRLSDTHVEVVSDYWPDEEPKYLVEKVRPTKAEPSSCSESKGPRKNQTLEQKTAEFNRTLFHVEMGRGFEDDYAPQYPEICPSHMTAQMPQQQPEISHNHVTPETPPQLHKNKAVVITLADQPQCQQDKVYRSPQAFGTAITQAWEQEPIGSVCNAADTQSRVPNEQPWRPGTLAAFPRPTDSRSNYGAVERLLRGCGGSERCQWRQEDDLIKLLDMLEMEHLSQPNQRVTQTPPPPTAPNQRVAKTPPPPTAPNQRVAKTPPPPTAPNQRVAKTPCPPMAHTKEAKTTPQDRRDSSSSSSSSSSFVSKKSFSRPARPANQRPPSRWASYSPTTPSSTVSSSSASSRKQTLSFSYHTETVII